MRILALTLATSVLLSFPTFAGGWETQRIHNQFFTEGASAGDIDGDGAIDLVAGPMWFRGPKFTERTLIAEPRPFPVESYSDQFFSSVLDANGDGANDVLVIGFPGKKARLYLNPGKEGLGNHWEMKAIAPIVDNESPAVVDLIQGGLPEIVCGREGQYGYYHAGDDATQSWNWIPFSRPGTCAGRFAHGMGVGDVNGDGRLDVLDKTFWWEQPETNSQKQWTQRRWAPDAYGGGGAQICVADLDEDGDADIVTSLNAHGYGLAWFEQQGDQFTRHDIMGASSTENDYGVVFSQLHAVALEDMDGDGRKDIVTGKRWMAHRGKDPGGLQEPVLYWFRNVPVDSGIEFVPRMIDDDSGVGVDVLVVDVNNDSRPDVISSSKHGLAVHRQQGEIAASKEAKWKVSEGRDQSRYADGFTPSQAAQNMLVANGFAVDLIASEPALTQPIAMCFDARGRIWVLEGHTYPTKAPKGQGRDRVVIFSDEDADGSFETKKTFIEGLNLASGIEVGFGGVWIGAAPELLFIPDADRDDVPDAEPVVLLDGWGHQDTHETLNSFTWGPDGWLYGCHGVFTHSRVGKPGTPDAERIPLNAGVWRYHPTEHRFEVFAHGTSNPWGVDFNDQGDWFISACVIPHLYHIQQGARYQRQGGQHFNPYTYDDIKTIADHAHYVGSIREHAYWGDNKVNKPSAPIGTSVLGGGHAHCGLAIYNGDVFPADYDNALLFHNLHGHRVVREKVMKNGSGYVGLHRPDFALARDHKEIGVGVMVGPDGAIYTSDWHDVQTCHNGNSEVWDRTDGRLFRIRYGKVQPQQFNLWKETDAQLVDRLRGNGFFARQAQRVLQERAATGQLNRDAINQKLAGLLESDESRLRMRALWTSYCTGLLGDEDIRRLLRHKDEYVRGWSVHFAGEKFPAGDFDFGDYEFRDDSPVVRRYLASILQRLPAQKRFPIIESLASYSIDTHDPNLPLLVWYGLEPLVEQDASRAFAIAKRSGWPNLARFVLRRSATTPSGREALVAQLLDPKRRVDRLMILEELVAAAKERAGLKMPEQWPDAFTTLSKAQLPRVRELSQALAVQFGDASVLPYFRRQLLDPSESIRNRHVALDALRTAKDPNLADSLLGLLGDPRLNEHAISSLASIDDERIPVKLLERLPMFSQKARTAALGTLVARSQSATLLVDAMERGEVDPKDVPAFIVRQVAAHGDADLNKRLEKVWGRISLSGSDLGAQYAKYRAMLRPKMIAGADASAGRVLYETNCGKCHKLFGVGGDIGPDITGANRTQVNYWLENILDPNALIGKAYQVTTILTEGGRVLTGIIKSENDDAVTIQTATDVVVVSQDEIESLKPSEVSLMPMGQLETMSSDQVRSLFKYLMSPGQVPRTGELSASPAVTPLPVPAGGQRYEGESLANARATAGNVRPQGMKGFGPAWSNDSQLWWTGATAGETLTFSLAPTIKGPVDLTLQLTSAIDYAQANVTISGNPPKTIDLFSQQVSLAAPMIWEGLQRKDREPIEITIQIVGANQAAKPAMMVGIDHVTVSPTKSSTEK